MDAALTDPSPTLSALDEGAAPFRLAACPRCGYALNGLPAVGVCPECGRAYDDVTVYLYGHAAGGKAREWTRPKQPAWQWWCAAAVLVVLVALVARPGAGRWMWLQFWWVPVSFGGMFAGAWLRRDVPAGSGVVRVRVGPDGVAQGVRGFGPVPFDRADRAKPVPWTRVGRVRVTRQLGGLARVVISSTDHWSQWRTDHVDAVVACSAADVAALGQRVDRWWRPGGVRVDFG